MYNTLRLIFQSFFCTIIIGGSMKNKFIKSLLVILLLFSLSFLSFKYIDNIKADSGWDSSYDSGGSWDSGSDWGSSSWDNDYDYDYDNDNDNDNDYSSGGSSISSCNTTECKVKALIAILITFSVSFAIPFLIVILSNKSLKKQRQRKEENLKLMFEGISQEKANSIITDFNIEDFNFKAYQIFYDVQMAWMDFDYDKLKELLTDELYNSYVMQLDALKVKNHKNTMKGFELINSCLFDLQEENGLYIAKVYLNVKFYDYVENEKTGMILRGTPNRKLNNIYKLTFIRTKEETNNINECPRCGSTVQGNATGVCEYCKSKLINKKYDWVLSKKEKINQR